MQHAKTEIADRELNISRLLSAPVERVWEVWTDPGHIKNWWGPAGFTNSISKMEVTPGGAWHLIMHGPDGTDYRNESIFKEIIPYKKIVYNHMTGPKFTATISFETRGEQTLLHWQLLFQSTEEFTRTVITFKADEGLRQNVEKLEAYVHGLFAAT